MHQPDSEAKVFLEALYRAGRFGGHFYAGFLSAVPGDHCEPASVVEFTAPSYQRVALASTSAGFAAAVDRAIETIVATTFAAPAEDWGIPRAIGLFDTATKGTGTLVAVRLLSADAAPILAGGSAPVAPAGLIRFFAP